MRTVWKYVLGRPVSTIETPPGPVRHVAAQGLDVCIWIEVDDVDALAPIERTFHAVNTGGEVPDDATYLGTAHVAASDGDVVWHVYVERPKPRDPTKPVARG